jgi:hypothetical protein
MNEENSRARCFVDSWIQRVPLDWERMGDMGLWREREKEGVGSGREVERRGMEVSGPELKGKEIERSRDGRGWGATEERDCD